MSSLGISCDTLILTLKVKVSLRLTVSQSESLGVETHLGPMTRYLLFFESHGIFVGRRLCCWHLPAQAFSGPSPLGFATIFYCLRFENSLLKVTLRLTASQSVNQLSLCVEPHLGLMTVTVNILYKICFHPLLRNEDSFVTAIPMQRSVGIPFVAVGTQYFPCIRCRGSMCSHCSRCAAMDVK